MNGRPSSHRDHQEMLSSMLTYLRDQGHEILAADHKSIPIKPGLFGNSRPDIVSKDVGKIHITEVETCDSINHSHTRGQWLDFHRANAKFLIVVPERCVLNAKNRANELGVEATIFSV